MMPCLVLGWQSEICTRLFSLNGSLVKLIKGFLGSGWEMEWIGMIQMTWGYSTLTCCLASGTLLRKKCLCMLGLLFPFLLVSTREYCQKHAGCTFQGPALLFLSQSFQQCTFCRREGKAFSSAQFEGGKVTWRERHHECHKVRKANMLLRSLTPPPGVL